MIDIHCHILPGIDDGPPTIEQSLALARSLAVNGYCHVIATPHSGDGLYNATPELIAAKTAELNLALQTANIPLSVYPGAEYPLTPNLLSIDPITLNNSRYLLVELPFFQPIPGNTEDLFFRLMAKGLTPILAHPERCAGILNDPKKLRAYVRQGVLTQVTVSSLRGRFGRRAKKLVMDWGEQNLIHFLATDSHRPVGEGHSQKLHSISEKEWDKLTSSNPVRVLENLEVHPGNPVRPKLTVRKLSRSFGLFNL